MKVSEVLYGAADHIAVFGHHKGDAYGDNGDGWLTSPSCMIGALGAVGHSSRVDYHPALVALRAYLGNITRWSDAHDQAEVVEALRACAVIEAAKEDEAANQSPAATPDVEPAL